MKSYLLLFLFPFFLTQCGDDLEPVDEQPETVTDVDGNVYGTVQLGNQTWMLENLKVTRLNDGTPIAEYSGVSDWHNGNTPVAYFQWADTNDLNNVHDQELAFDHYGALYNHFAIETGKLAPEGWRIPTVADFMELQDFLSAEGHNGNEAIVLKSSFGWLPSSGNGTDLFGFNALPNGYASAFGTPTAAELICTWATSSFNNGNRVMIQLFDQDVMLFSDNAIQIGAGIRCIKE